ncbi:MAG: STAS domain-containing protein [Proteobacteria bacterium]|nr:STAS domain-containing protein [Pseudomonadota bacterium]
MIHVGEDSVEVSGAMTLPLASELLAEGCAAMTNPDVVFDLAAVTDVDSSSIAVIFGWLREAQKQGKKIRIVHPPDDLLNLAAVYDVTGMLPLA